MTVGFWKRSKKLMNTTTCSLSLFATLCPRLSSSRSFSKPEEIGENKEEREMEEEAEAEEEYLLWPERRIKRKREMRH